MSDLTRRALRETWTSAADFAERTGLRVETLNGFMAGWTGRPAMATLRKVENGLRELLAERL